MMMMCGSWVILWMVVLVMMIWGSWVIFCIVLLVMMICFSLMMFCGVVWVVMEKVRVVVVLMMVVKRVFCRFMMDFVWWVLNCVIVCLMELVLVMVLGFFRCL